MAAYAVTLTVFAQQVLGLIRHILLTIFLRLLLPQLNSMFLHTSIKRAQF